MTISTTACHVTQLGNGVTTAWNFDFVAGEPSWLTVSITNTTTLATTILNPVQYSIYLNPVPVGGLWSIGGIVNYPLVGPPLPAGWTITIGRYVPLTQSVSIANQGAFYPQAVEQALDILELQIQDLTCDIQAIQQTIDNFLNTNFQWDYPYFASGTTTDGETFTIVNMVRNLTLPANCPRSVFTCGLNPTANTTITLYKNVTNIGTIVFHTDGTYTLTFASDVSFVNGDQFKVVNQATADATFGNMSLTFVFNLTA